MKIHPIHKKLYPIYLFSLKWIEDIPPKNEWGFKHEQKFDVSEGRMRNSTGFRKIFRVNQTNEQLQQYIDNYINILKLEEKHKNISDIEVHFEFVENESWVLT